MKIQNLFDVCIILGVIGVVSALATIVIDSEKVEAVEPKEVKIHCHDVARNEFVWLRRCNVNGEIVYLSNRHLVMK